MWHDIPEIMMSLRCGISRQRSASPDMKQAACCLEGKDIVQTAASITVAPH